MGRGARAQIRSLTTFSHPANMLCKNQGGQNTLTKSLPGPSRGVAEDNGSSLQLLPASKRDAYGTPSSLLEQHTTAACLRPQRRAHGPCKRCSQTLYGVCIAPGYTPSQRVPRAERGLQPAHCAGARCVCAGAPSEEKSAKQTRACAGAASSPQ